MRVRNAAAAAFSALALVVAFPTSATAVPGEFTYQYTAPDGTTAAGAFVEPEGGQCLNIPEAKDAESTQPAHSPYNKTPDGVFLYAEVDCADEGDPVKLTAGQKLGEDTKFRAVIVTTNP
ncbi:hypothetical protein [Streptomyces virginiae]|uniref:hypothetical protein n=1 Tax=Streptomyces virginiae TaxID=1961 RepID=UPI002DBBCE14|nr:hypothetical protein [Streptomyces sp. CMAA1738]MEC4575072.1 hypothetical protein [Streptomyces sp. CMAA1738]